MKKIITQIIAGIWVLYIVYLYYSNNDYYIKSLTFYYREFIAIFIIGFILLLSLRLIGKIINMTLFKLTLLFLLISLISFNIINYYQDVSIFKSGFQDGVFVQQGQSFRLFDSRSKVADPTSIIVKEGDVVQQTSLFTTGFPQQAKNLFFQNSLIESQLVFTSKFLYYLLLAFLIIFICFITGSNVFKWLFQNINGKITAFEELIFSIGIGFTIITSFLFILGFFGRLFYYEVLGLMFILTIINARQIKHFADIIFKEKFSIAIFSPVSILLIILGYFIGFHIIDILRPIPVSWDEVNEYLNLPNLIAQTGSLIPRPAYYFSLFMSLGKILTGQITAEMFIAFSFSLLAISALYIFLRKFLSQFISLLLTITFYSLPVVFWMIGVDVKTDMALLFMSLLSILSLFYWHNSGKNINKFLWLSALFLGFAFGIKYTALLLIITIVSYLFYLKAGKIGILFSLNASLFIFKITGTIFIEEFITFDKPVFIILLVLLLFSSFLLIFQLFRGKLSYLPLKQIVIYILLIIIPFLPWAFKNLISSPELTYANIMFGKHEVKIPFSSLGVDNELCSAMGGNEEIERYTGGTLSLTNLLKFPWDATMNIYLNKQHVDISFIFLAIIPALAILSFIKTNGILINKGDYLKTITLFTVIYYLLFFLTSKGIIWYGLSIFIGLLLILGTLISQYAYNKSFWKYILCILFVIWFAGVMPVRYRWAANNEIIAYINSYIDEQGFTEKLLPGTLAAQNLFQTALKNNDTKIWRIGTFLKYWIPNNHLTVVDDDSMYGLNCLYLEKNYQTTIQRLKKFGVRYVIFDQEAASIEDNSTGPVHKRFSYVQDFVSHLQPVLDTGRYTIYEIPISS